MKLVKVTGYVPGMEMRAVVQEERVTRLDSAEDFQVRQLNAFGIAGSLIGIERKTLSLDEHGGAIGKLADPQFRTL